MEYPEVFSARLPNDLGTKVRDYADKHRLRESEVLRLAVKQFFRKPPRRVTRNRVRATQAALKVKC